jgi:F420-non-reducing hydrogenase iron-sulfur subunit
MTEFKPRILVFSTDNVSDPGIDLAGRNKMHYPASVFVVTLPCSSAIKPRWIFHALMNGFDGVFIAGEGAGAGARQDGGGVLGLRRVVPEAHGRV